ncbi:MAG: DUF4386 family protein [Steroidobacteraceae bacterium]
MLEQKLGWGMKFQSMAEIRGARSLATLAFVAGTLSLLLLLASLRPPPPTPAEQLSFAATHRGAYGLFGSLVLTWAVFSVPLIVTLRKLLQPKGDIFALSAQLLSVAGILMLAFGIFTHVGALLSIAAATSPSRPDDGVYQATIWSNLGFYLSDPGLMTWGLGQFLFGWIAWRSGIFANWVALLGMIGGVAGLLTLAVFQTGLLALVQISSFTVWAFATGLLLRRAPSA